MNWRCPADGKTTLHALGSLEARGSLFTAPATEVYQGMVSRSPMIAFLLWFINGVCSVLLPGLSCS